MLPHSLQPQYPLIFFLFIKILQNFRLGSHIYVRKIKLIDM